MADIITSPTLSHLIFLPIIGAILLLLLPLKKNKTIHWFSFLFSLIPFSFTIPIFLRFKPLQNIQFVEKQIWIKPFNIYYHIGIDGISILLVLLTNFLIPLVFLSSFKYIQEHLKTYYISFFILQTGVIGSFLSLDMFLFYVFWELMLLPMYFIIGIWGGKRRIEAAIKFLIFTAFGSFLMFLSILYLVSFNYFQKNTLDFTIFSYYNIQLPHLAGVLCFFGFLLGFAIKVPMVPLHTWLPDAHTEAPAGGSIILAGILLKLGTYGLIRFLIPIFPKISLEYFPLLLILSVIGIIYGGLLSFAQDDFKKLIAYSSVSHMGFITLGIFSLNFFALNGALLQMINHGLSTGALFLLAGMLYERKHTRMMEDFGGIAKVIPTYTAFFIFVSLSSIGLPGLNGFWGEFLVLIGTFQEKKIFAILGATGVVLSAVYLLTGIKKVFFGEIKFPENERFKDLDTREWILLLCFSIPIIWIGIYPKFFLSKISTSIEVYLNMIKGFLQ